MQIIGRGGSRILGKGLINKFTTRRRVREGACPSRDSKGVWVSADCSFSGVWGEAPAAFLLLHLFSMKFTVIYNTYTSRDIREPEWIATRKLFILHNVMVPTALQLNSRRKAFVNL